MTSRLLRKRKLHSTPFIGANIAKLLSPGRSAQCFPPIGRDNARRTISGFSVAELVVVMGIMAVLTSLTVPAIHGINNATAVSSGGGRLAGLLSLARTEAIARHTIVRFAVATNWDGNADADLRKVSIWAWNAEARQYLQLTEWETLTDGTVMEPNLPGYIHEVAYARKDGASVRGDCVLDPGFAGQAEFQVETPTPVGGQVTSRFIEFLPNGGAQVPGGTSRNLIFVLAPGFRNTDGSITYNSQSAGHPTNWAQLNVDTLTGRVRFYQP